MNAPIVRLFGLVIVLFGVLVVVHVALDGVRGRGAARQPEQPPRPVRGAADQARDHPRRRRDACWRPTARSRRSATSAAIPTGELFSHPVGFTSLDRGRTGLEDYYNDPLTGRRERRDRRARAPARPAGRRRRPAHDARRRAPRRPPTQQLGGRHGAVVALDVKTGAVRVMAATPSLRPERPGRTPETFNRATQGRFPPGSTMKTVTATAALDSGATSPTRRSAARTAR